jgi:hypothetical protein
MDGEPEHRPVGSNVAERPPSQEINGVELALGAMTVAELTQIQAACKERLESAKLDMLIINDYIHAASVNAYSHLRPIE